MLSGPPMPARGGVLCTASELKRAPHRRVPDADSRHRGESTGCNPFVAGERDQLRGPASAHGRKVPCSGRRQALGARRDLWSVPPRRARPRVSIAGRLARDFALMATHGFNAVRTYTVPPPGLLDAAQAHGLWVLVGIPVGAARHLSGRSRPGRATIVERVRAGVRACAGHPAVLGYAIGNEIPSPIVRWHGRRRVGSVPAIALRGRQERRPGRARHLRQLPDDRVSRAALPRLRHASTSIWSRTTRLDAYLARLQNIAGDRPLMLAEIGLDSRRNGEAGAGARPGLAAPHRVRRRLRGRLRLRLDRRMASGRLRHRGLGLRPRRPRRAAQAGARRRARARSPELPLPAGAPVAAHLGGRVHLQRGAHHPRLPGGAAAASTIRTSRSIVVDDGSTDDTAAIAREYGVRLIRTPNRGLSSARNTGLAAATGEIVAYIDDDAYPDPALAAPTSRAPFTDHATMPAWAAPTSRRPDDGPIAACVANAPGRAGPRAPDRHRGRAHPGLQHGLPARVPGGDRRLRRPVPRRRRRRRRVLAAAGARLDARLPRRRDGLAPPAELGARLLAPADAATAGPRRCSSGSGRRSTTGRPPGVGGPRLRPRARQAGGLGRRAGSTRAAGGAPPSSRSTSLRRSAGRRCRHARVVSGHRRPRRPALLGTLWSRRFSSTCPFSSSPSAHRWCAPG